MNHSFLSIKTVILSVILSISGPVSFGQDLSLTTNSTREVTVCSEDPITFTVALRNLSSQELEDIVFFTDLPEGLEYIAGSEQGMSLISTAPLQFSVGNMSSGPDSKELVFQAIADCRLREYARANFNTDEPVLINNKSSVTYTLAGQAKQYDEPSGSETYTVLFPELALQVEEEDRNKAAVQLNLPLQRHLNLENTGRAALSEVRLQLEHMGDLQVSTVKVVDAGDNPLTELEPFSENDTKSIFIIRDFSGIGNGNALFEPGESLKLMDEVLPTACGASLATNYTALWGCGDNFCNEDEQDGQATAYINAVGGTPNVVPLGKPVILQKLDYCTNPQGRTALVFRNEATSGNNETPASYFGAYNLWIALGYDHEYIDINNIYLKNPSNGRLSDITPLFSDISPGDTRAALYELLQEDRDGTGTGIDDLDGDGFYDDLPLDQQIELVIDYTLSPHITYDPAEKQVLPINVLSVRTIYDSWCRGAKLSTNMGSNLVTKDFISHEVSGPKNLKDGETGTFTFKRIGNHSAEMIDYSNGEIVSEIQLPDNYRYVPNSVRHGIAPEGTFDIVANQTGKLLTLRHPIIDYGTHNQNYVINHEYSLDLSVACTEESTRIENIEWKMYYIANKACPEIRILSANTGLSVNNDCIDCTNIGFETQSFSAERSTFGWEPPTKRYYTYDELYVAKTAPRITADSPGIRLDAAYPGDEVTMDLQGKWMAIGSTDNVQVAIEYEDIFEKKLLSFKSARLFIDNVEYSFSDTFAPTATLDGNTRRLTFPIPMGQSGLPATITPGQEVRFTAIFERLEGSGKLGEHLMKGLQGSLYHLDGTGNRQKCKSLTADFLLIEPRYGLSQRGRSTGTCDGSTGLLISAARDSYNFPNEYRPLQYLKTVEVTAPDGFIFNTDRIPTFGTVTRQPFSIPKAYEGVDIRYTTDKRTATLTYTDRSNLPIFHGGSYYFYYEPLIAEFIPDCDNTDNPYIYGRPDQNFLLPDVENIHTTVTRSERAYLPDTDKHLTKTDPNDSRNNRANYRSVNFRMEANSVQEAYAREVSWPVTFSNSSTYFTVPMANSWVAIELPDGENGISIVGIKDGEGQWMDTDKISYYGPKDALHPEGKHLFLQLGELGNNSSTEIQVVARYTNCSDNSLQSMDIHHSWSCNGYPTLENNTQSIIEQLDDIGCEVPLKSDKMYIRYREESSDLLWTVKRLGGDGEIDLCAPVPFEVDILSSKYANVSELKTVLSLPEGITLQNSSIQYSFASPGFLPLPMDLVSTDGTQQTILDLATLLSRTLPEENGELPGTRLPGKNRIRLRFDLFGNCDFDPGQVIGFSLFGTTNCGQPLRLDSQKKIKLLGFPEDIMELNMLASGFDDCSRMGAANITLRNAGLNRSSPTQLLVTLPKGLNYVNMARETPSVTAPIVQPQSDGSTLLRWDYPSGELSPDETKHLSVYMSYGQADFDRTFEVKARTIINGQATCVDEGNSSCPLIATSGEATMTVTTVRPSIEETITITGPSEACEGTPIALSIPDSYASYQWYRNGQPITTAGKQHRYLPTETGNYSVQIDCGRPSPPVSIIVHPTPILNLLDVLATTCEQSNDGEVTFQVTGGGAASYNYRIYSTNVDFTSGTIADGQTFTIDALPRGVYSLLITNPATDCRVQQKVRIEDGAPRLEICARKVPCGTPTDGSFKSSMNIIVRRGRSSEQKGYRFELRDTEDNTVAQGTGKFFERFTTEPILPYTGESYTFHLLSEEGNFCEEFVRDINITPVAMSLKLNEPDALYEKCAANQEVEVQIDASSAGSCTYTALTRFDVAIKQEGKTVRTFSNLKNPISLTGLPEGKLTAEVTGTGINTGTCTAGIDFEIQRTILKADIDARPPSCALPGDDGSASVAVTGGTGPLGYQWLNEDDEILSILPTVQGLSEGRYRLRLQNIHCAEPLVQTFDITAPAPLGNLSLETVPNSCNVTALLENAGGTPPYTFHWYLLETVEEANFVYNEVEERYDNVPIERTLRNEVFTDVGIQADKGTAISTTTTNTAKPGDYIVEVTDSNGCSLAMEEAHTIENPQVERSYNIAFRWKTPAKEKETAPNRTIPLNTLNIRAASMGEAVQEKAKECLEQQSSKFGAAYGQYCMNTDFIEDEVTFSYGIRSYQHTLYYYDRAGNLTRTIPPKGIRPLDRTQLDRSTGPEHMMGTTYDYNSLGQLTAQHSPDGGRTRFLYNDMGQLRFSQNARQAEADKNAFSYTKYDALGRITEVGEAAFENNYTHNGDTYTVTGFDDLGTSGLIDLDRNNKNLPIDERFPTEKRSERTLTHYSNTQPGSGSQRIEQRYLRNRVGYTEAINLTGDTITTAYSYDPHGNVAWLQQQLPQVGAKTIAYDYDLISGNVLEVAYDPLGPDPFFHRYTYDEDNRIRSLSTSRDHFGWDSDARYTYFDHGPLKNTIIGEDRVQKIDYTYTLHGWLKAINGEEPSTLTQHLGIPKDAYAMQLGYYNGDFANTGSPFNSSGTDPSRLRAEEGRELYNGNISTWQSTTLASDNQFVHTGFRYHYDRLNRIKQGSFFAKRDDKYFQRSGFATSFRYDPNGNLLQLDRNDIDGEGMDRLKYHYPNTDNNRLGHVDDAATIPQDKHNKDLEDQKEGNYSYDAIGNLIRDEQEKTDIEWTVYGKVAGTEQEDGSKTRFLYDAAGNRVLKQRKDKEGNLSSDHYLRDASGNIMAIYKSQDIEGEQKRELSEIPLYGSERIGTFRPTESLGTGTELLQQLEGRRQIGNYQGRSYALRPDSEIVLGPGFSYDDGTDGEGFHVGSTGEEPPLPVGTFRRSMDRKQYELKDHLGNVRALIGDRKTADSENNTEEPKPLILSASSYYPFGMDMPVVKWSKETYLATMETSRMEEEKKDFDNYNDKQRVNAETFNHTPSPEAKGAKARYSYRLDGTDSDNIIGLAKSLKVQAGDKVSMEVYGKFTAPKKNAKATNAANLLASAFVTSFGVPVGYEGAVAWEQSIGELLSPTGTLFADKEDSGVQGYLNYILFDEDFVVQGQGFQKLTRESTVPGKSGKIVEHEKLFLEVIPEKDGYLYAYLSNETGGRSEAHFDDMRIEHEKLVPDNSRAGKTYRFAFQGIERDGSYGSIANYAFQYRIYNPAAARFLSVDPLTGEYPWNSPYSFQENKLGLGRELEGLELAPFVSPEVLADAYANAEDNDPGFMDYAAAFGRSILRAFTPVGTGERMMRATQNYANNEIDHAVNRGERYERAVRENTNPAEVSQNYEFNKFKAKIELVEVGIEAFGWAAGAAQGSLESVAATSWKNIISSSLIELSPSQVRFSQSSVNGADDLISSMRINGWKGSPIDVVRMNDGLLTSVDNTRVLAAHEAGVNIKANVHAYNEPLPVDLIERFTTKKGVPKTWGEAIDLRIGKQKATYRNNNPKGSMQIEGKLKK